MNEEELIRNINTYLRSKALYQHTIKKKTFMLIYYKIITRIYCRCLSRYLFTLFSQKNTKRIFISKEYLYGK